MGAGQTGLPQAAAHLQARPGSSSWTHTVLQLACQHTTAQCREGCGEP